jgi:hypothetical protein
MKLRTNLDLFGAALLSALGATQVACGGKAGVIDNAGDSGGPGIGAGNAGQSGSGQGGSSAGANSQSGSGQGGGGQAGSGQAGASHGGTSNAGGQSDGGTSGAGTVGAGAGPSKYPCQNPKDLGNGFVQCDGFKHRQSVATCASQVPRPDPVPNPTMTGACKVDADCTEKPYGWCGTGGDVAGTYCNYGCVKDSDCGAQQLCECADPVGQCVNSQCSSDAQCADGFLCREYDRTGGCNVISYSCQTPGDSCGSDADCAPVSGQFSHCRVDQTKPSFQCIPGGCAVGRPFLVEGAERLARKSARGDWTERHDLPDRTALNASQRTRLAEHWTRIALMEHASIAAFARFTLQLMSLAAPASLIERATAATRDETKHAKACFALASAYASAPIGPGRLSVEGSLEGGSLEQIVLNTIREGCVGETVAALEAHEAAEYAADPAVRALLLQISEDETRHAELAYCFVQWALSSGDAALQAAVEHEFAALATQTTTAHGTLSAEDEQRLRHGIVPEAMRRVLRARAIAQVILPCSRALLAAPRAGSVSAESSEYAS